MTQFLIYRAEIHKKLNGCKTTREIRSLKIYKFLDLVPDLKKKKIEWLFFIPINILKNKWCDYFIILLKSYEIVLNISIKTKLRYNTLSAVS